MKVVLITEKDAANASLCRIGNAFYKKGHEVRICDPVGDPRILHGFLPEIKRYSFDKSGDELLDWCDLVFCANGAVKFFGKSSIMDLRKPIFTQEFLINKQVRWGGDLCFVPSLETATTDYDAEIPHIHLAIGEPKYDGSQKQNDTGKHKKFLFIDSGHYPYGKKGKEQLADCLLSVCRNFPDYCLTIKPRFLPGDKTITHRNLQLLQDVVLQRNDGRLPENMIFLSEHRGLMELIEESDTVLCLYTTAFAGAYAAGKGLVILDGLDSEDVYDARFKVYRRIRDNMECTGALVPWRNVCAYLPEGIHADEKTLKKLFAEWDNTADKIVETTEDLCSRFYFQNRFPKITDCEYADYRDHLICDETADWDSLIDRRKRNYLMREMLIHTDFRVDETLDMNEAIDYVSQIDFQKTDLKTALKERIRVRSECILKNRGILMKNPTETGVLLNAYYLLGKYEDILNFKKKDFGSYELFAGFSYYKLGRIRYAAELLKKYFERTKNRPYIQEISDMSDNRYEAFHMLFASLEELGEKTEIPAYMEQLKTFFKIQFATDEIPQTAENSAQEKYLQLIKHYS